MHCPFCAADDTKVIDSRLVAEGDQVRRRLGSGADRGKRSVTTDAAPFDTDAAAALGHRPPVTDALAIAAIVAEVRGYMATFPAPMREALELWLDETSFDEIATKPTPMSARSWASRTMRSITALT